VRHGLGSHGRAGAAIDDERIFSRTRSARDASPACNLLLLCAAVVALAGAAGCSADSQARPAEDPPRESRKASSLVARGVDAERLTGPVILPDMPGGRRVMDFATCPARPGVVATRLVTETFVLTGDAWEKDSEGTCSTPVYDEVVFPESNPHRSSLGARYGIYGDMLADSYREANYFSLVHGNERRHVFLRQRVIDMIGGVCRVRSCEGHDATAPRWGGVGYHILRFGQRDLVHVRTMRYSSPGYLEILIPIEYFLSRPAFVECIGNLQINVTSESSRPALNAAGACPS